MRYNPCFKKIRQWFLKNSSKRILKIIYFLDFGVILFKVYNESDCSGFGSEKRAVLIDDEWNCQDTWDFVFVLSHKFWVLQNLQICPKNRKGQSKNDEVKCHGESHEMLACIQKIAAYEEERSAIISCGKRRNEKSSKWKRSEWIRLKISLGG